MSCLYGSRKKPSAVNFINPNDIGVLCSLFGLEGALCRLLDLVPSAVKKIASLNPDVGNADQVFGDILKKVADKLLGLAINSVTGNIEIASFCTLDPPDEPEDITFSDVFIFIGELVPIVSTFFTVNEILSGNSTKILDKIVGFWLREQWFKNCECKPELDKENPNPYKPTVNPRVSNRCLSDADTNSANAFIAQVNAANAASAKTASVSLAKLGNLRAQLEAQIAVFESLGYTNVFISELSCPPASPDIFQQGSRQYGCAVLLINTKQYKFGICSARYEQIYFSPEGIKGSKFYQENYEQPFDIQITTDYIQCVCPPPQISPPEEFRRLFPDDPLSRVLGCTDKLADNYNPLANFDDGSCTYLNNPNCEEERTMVSVFNRCGIPRKTVELKLYKAGTQENISVSIWVGCNQPKSQAVRSLFKC